MSISSLYVCSAIRRASICWASRCSNAKTRPSPSTLSPRSETISQLPRRSRSMWCESGHYQQTSHGILRRPSRSARIRRDAGVIWMSFVYLLHCLMKWKGWVTFAASSLWDKIFVVLLALATWRYSGHTSQRQPQYAYVTHTSVFPTRSSTSPISVRSPRWTTSIASHSSLTTMRTRRRNRKSSICETPSLIC